MRILLLSLMAVTLLACSSAKSNQPEQNQALIGSWAHAFEKDSEGVKVYQPADGDFPPARFRQRLEFKADGSLLALQLAANDAHNEAKGQWEWKAEGRLLVTLPSGEKETWEVRELNAETLKVVVHQE